MAPGDDFAMMREVLTRRFKRLLKGDAEEAGEAEARAQTSLRTADSQSKHRIDLGPSRRTGRRRRRPSACRTVWREPSQRGQTPLPADGKLARNARVQRGSDPTGASRCPKPMMTTTTTTPSPRKEFPDWPDLILIDGGKGQLGEAQKVLDELGISRVALAGVAKGPDRDAGREHFHRTGQQPFMLEPRDPVLYFIQRLRDEAHRFAIGSHRAKRKKEIPPTRSTRSPASAPSANARC